MRTLSSPSIYWDTLRSLNFRSLGIEDPDNFRNKAISSSQLVRRLTLAEKVEVHDGCVNSLNFSSSGDFLCSGSDDLKVAIYSWTDNQLRFKYDSGHSGNIFQSKIMPNTCDSTIVTTARDGQVRVGFLSSREVAQQTRKVAQHKGASHKLGIEPDSPHIMLSAGEDAAVFNVDLRENIAHKILTVTNEKKSKVALYAIQVNPRNINEFAVCGRDIWARIYDRRKISTESDSIVKRFCPEKFKNPLDQKFPPNITCLAYAYNGTEILCSYNDDDIYLFDAVHGSESDSIRSYCGHRNSDTIKGVNFFGPRSEYVVSGSDCGHIFLWDKNTMDIIQFMEGDRSGVVNVLEPHPNCCVLATSGLDPDIKIWTPTGQVFDTGDKKLKDQMKENEERRVEDRQRPQDIFDSPLLFFIMRNYNRERRRALRRTLREAEEEVSSDTDDSDEEDTDSDVPEEAPTTVSTRGEQEDEEADIDSASSNRCVQS